MTAHLGRRVVPVLLLVVAALAVGLLAFRGGDEDYAVVVSMDNAKGLRDGSPVKVNGVTAGHIEDLGITGPRDAVEARLALEAGVRIGRGARAEVVTSNLLGSKFIELDPGDRSAPEPSGTRIPRSRVTTPTDLDEVLNMLDTDTRTRLQILINEMGTALTGRRTDFNEVLRLLPGGLARSRQALAEVVSDNETMARLIRDAGGFIDATTRRREDLNAFIRAAGQTVETTARRNRELRGTLARAPQTLREARTFLADLEATTRPLGPAARTLAGTAPTVTGTLSQLPGFVDAARPALRSASDVAPSLTKLAARATPTVRELRPTAQALATFGQDLAPLSRALKLSIGDIVAIVEGWARAIQNRDGISHIFHGRATLTADMVVSLIDRISAARTKQSRRRPKSSAPAKKNPVEDVVGKLLPKAPKPAAPPRAPKLPKLPDVVPGAVTDTVQGILDGVVGAVTGKQAAPDRQGEKPLLDSLLKP